jgi:hypothetical protein
MAEIASAQRKTSRSRLGFGQVLALAVGGALSGSVAGCLIGATDYLLSGGGLYAFIPSGKDSAGQIIWTRVWISDDHGLLFQMHYLLALISSYANTGLLLGLVGGLVDAVIGLSWVGAIRVTGASVLWGSVGASISLLLVLVDISGDKGIMWETCLKAFGAAGIGALYGALLVAFGRLLTCLVPGRSKLPSGKCPAA